MHARRRPVPAFVLFAFPFLLAPLPPAWPGAAALVSVAAAQESPLRAGPMVGYSEMREVLLWAQTRGPATVRFSYWNEADPSVRYHTGEVTTDMQTAFTAKVVVPHLEPGTRYGYRVEVDGSPVEVGWPLRFQTQALWQWREDPPDFRVVAASCFYVNDPPYDRPGEPYGGEFEILDAVRAAAPDAMVWLGDNVYLREADWYSRSGILYRYSHTRAYPGLQPLLGSVHHYATWDDHDYGPDNSDWTWREKATAKEAFDLFWGNPEGGPPEFGGITTSFQWGDVEFFLLDDRWHRSSEHRIAGRRQMLGKDQLRWLVDALATSRATFKIVATGGQVLNPEARWESYATFPEERAELLEALRANDIRGVLFLTGDVHYSVLTKLDRRGTYPLYDLTVSPLTAGPTDTDEERNRNHLRVPGTLFAGRSFATLDVSGPRTDRVLRIAVRDVSGREVWSREIRAAELR
ncbi:MAG: alkaline phosphatase D family protein [Gemmatimonadota bacterium]|nr:alkaline phosphatase D family protein [Gemmatimonadota bacterium]